MNDKGEYDRYNGEGLHISKTRMIATVERWKQERGVLSKQDDVYYKMYSNEDVDILLERLRDIYE